MTVVLLSSDLMVASRIEGAAARLGKTVRVAPSATQALGYVDAERTEAMIVDLSSPSLAVAALVSQLQATCATPPRVIAFGPHVHEARLAAARDAGCDVVISRGQFFAQLDSILA